MNVCMVRRLVTMLITFGAVALLSTACASESDDPVDDTVTTSSEETTPAQDPTQDLSADEVKVETPLASEQETTTAAVVTKEEEVQTPSDYTLSDAGGKAPPEPSMPIPHGDAVGAETPANTLSDTNTSVSALDAVVVAAVDPVMVTEQKAPQKAKRAAVASKAKKSKRIVDAPVAREAAAPADGNNGNYVVLPGDSISHIAAKIYGSSRRWRALAKLNGLDHPERIFPGDMIRYEMSDATKEFHDLYTGAARQEVTVRRGDTLSRIAKRVYGNDGYWKAVWRLNTETIKDPNRIEVGQKLVYVDASKLKQPVTH